MKLDRNGLRTMTCALVGALAFSVGSVSAKETVTVGYQLNYQPWKAAIADHEFEKATGYDIDWHQFDSGSQVISAVASGSVDVAMAGSSPIASAISHGVDLKLFYIVEGIGKSEALVVRKSAGIEDPEDLKGKTLGVPFVSTSHYDMMFALQNWGIEEGDLRLLNMQPSQAAAAWARGDIDGAFVWNPALQRMLRNGGKVMITSGDLCELGKCTFNGYTVRPEFADGHPDFMTAFVGVLDKYTMMYREHPDKWTEDSDLVKKVVSITGGQASDVPTVLGQYVFPSLDEQASERWLGGGADSGAAFSLKDTAKFLEGLGKVERVPEHPEDYVTDKWVKAAMEQ
ncbi:taurine ABC transporter substrate-binding protein [Arhodomonas aquaeolei]|uniref:taurine ABC transporter substrate-binding protein n=1 Tax=Arhodomonas aquaeolei TaxID=2369 RepID=UPI002167CBA5|nr:taurine ABC transporter substrate-binding protein [Arhodomonas aquaeolei]MCS4504457.1 taurine ABC transporter substrate-binding protein [Arhodomonas aquaeolei]